MNFRLWSRLGLEASENLGAFATVFQTEIVAITLIPREIFHRNLNTKIDICSDSQALGFFTSTLKPVRECKELLLKITEKCDLMTLWVAEHSGIDGNEKAYDLARDGSDSEFFCPEPAVGIFFNNNYITYMRSS